MSEYSGVISFFSLIYILYYVFLLLKVAESVISRAASRKGKF